MTTDYIYSTPATECAARANMRNAFPPAGKGMKLARPVYIRYQSSALEGPAFKTIETFEDAIAYTLATSHFMPREESNEIKVYMSEAIRDIALGKKHTECFGDHYNEGLHFKFEPGRTDGMVLRAYELSYLPWN